MLYGCLYAELTLTQAYLLHFTQYLHLRFIMLSFIFRFKLQYNIIIGEQHDGVYLSGSLPLLYISYFDFVCVLYFVANNLSQGHLYWC